MKILMRNIGMTLHVIHKLRERGLTNVQVNMDWQHLIMNGESLGEYAAMLAAEGLLGHQHANSGWGTFDDDNMVGATAFMETLELAVELRRARYGENGERLGFDLYPYTEDAVAAVARSVHQWRFIWDVSGRIDERRSSRRSRARTPSAPTSSSTPPWAPRAGGRAVTALVGLDVGTTGVKALALSPEGEVLAVASRGYQLSTPQRRLGRAGPGGVGRRGGVGAPRGRGRAATSPASGFSGQMHGLVVARRRRPGDPPGDPLERPAHRRRSAARSRSASGSSG